MGTLSPTEAVSGAVGTLGGRVHASTRGTPGSPSRSRCPLACREGQVSVVHEGLRATGKPHGHPRKSRVRGLRGWLGKGQAPTSCPQEAV